METIKEAKKSAADRKLANAVPNPTVEESELWHEKREFLVKTLKFPARAAEETATNAVRSFRRYFAT